MTAPTSPTEPDMNYDDDEAMPPPDMELRRLAIKAGLTQPTPLDTFHDMAGALGFRQAGSAEARIADLEARVREVEGERDRLLEDSHAAYAKSIEDRTKLISMNYDRGGEFAMSMVVAQEVMLRFVEASKTILDNAENYTESIIQELTPANGREGYVLTIQRKNGKTPHQKRVEAESDLAAARVTIGELVGGLKPFADWAEGWHAEWPDDMRIDETNTDWSPVLGDCRRAAALVARHQAQQ